MPTPFVPFHLEGFSAVLGGRERVALDPGNDHRSAVLVPVYGDVRAPRVAFVKRSEHLRRHGGQIAFPGGRLELGDEDVVACALREAHEEVGLEPRTVQIVGLLDDVSTVVTGYHITPVVGWLRSPPRWVPDGDEVTHVIELSLADVLYTPPNHLHHVEWKGRSFDVPAYRIDGALVWGATGRMVENLQEIVRAQEGRQGISKP